MEHFGCLSVPCEMTTGISTCSSSDLIFGSTTAASSGGSALLAISIDRGQSAVKIRLQGPFYGEGLSKLHAPRCLMARASTGQPKANNDISPNLTTPVCTSNCRPRPGFLIRSLNFCNRRPGLFPNVYTRNCTVRWKLQSEGVLLIIRYSQVSCHTSISTTVIFPSAGLECVSNSILELTSLHIIHKT